MKRSGFLKALVGIVAAPSILASVQAKTTAATIAKQKVGQNLNSDLFYIFTNNQKVRVYDLISSDLGDKAVVVGIGRGYDSYRLTLRPMIYKTYNAIDPEKFTILVRPAGEHSS